MCVLCVHIFLNEYRGENIGNKGSSFLFLMKIFSNMQLRENRMKQFLYVKLWYISSYQIQNLERNWMLKNLHMIKVKKWSANVILCECCDTTDQKEYTKEAWTPAICLNFHRFFKFKIWILLNSGISYFNLIITWQRKIFFLTKI